MLKIAEGRQMNGDIDNAVVDTYKFVKTNFDIDKKVKQLKHKGR